MQPYYFTADKQIDFQLDPEMQINLIQLMQQEILPCSNYNQLAYFTQISYPLPISAYQKKQRSSILFLMIQRNTDSKGRLLKSRQSENNLLIILLKHNFRMNNCTLLLNYLLRQIMNCSLINLSLFLRDPFTSTLV
ncbi:unnamed protein product [Paramecium primaurelia]|uniref:Uncharacterized protein n=1 Tax=Paramecium primaurelia TaxID=5886 RepID=A0A8S1L9U6_PARPR|nr:unnamed protein product [Paramecium primaurelia]